MNTFIHRIFKSSSGSSITKSHQGAVHRLVDDIQHAKLVYFGEFHSESRIVSFQTELVKEWSKRLALAPAAADGGRPPRLHLIMEHFSVDMQELLERYQSLDAGSEAVAFPDDDSEAFQQLVDSYKNYGTEGHDLLPYSNLLQFCRETTSKSEEGQCEILLHGGFIPRNHAARLNKECPDDESKKQFFEEMSNERGYLPTNDEAMFNALFESSDFKLRGPKEHKLLIQSLMNGSDLYSPAESKDDSEEIDGEEKPFDRLYQAQLLKDHAMAYRVANIMLDQPSYDRYLVIAGYGHLKHRLGVPECVNQYLRQTAILGKDEKCRTKAMDLLMNISIPASKSSRNSDGKGSALIGCQMIYEAYLEDNYPPLVTEIQKATDQNDDVDTDAIKQKIIKHLYLHDPTSLDEYILKSDEVGNPFLHFGRGIGGFEYPCADYLFVYDEDEDHLITESDITQASDLDSAKCPYHDVTSTHDDVKRETLEAYNQVGKTAGFKGNARRARAIMTILGYSESDLAYLGDGDIYNFQGVANPHIVAKIRRGESVIDIGSGLGIDSFLAMRDSGADGASSGSLVIGIDLAPSEVEHTLKRARARGYNVPERVNFIHGDVEKLQNVLSKQGLPPESNFDVCISNGAFCLVPDKKKAFQNGE